MQSSNWSTEGSLSFVQLKEAFPSVSSARTDLKALDQVKRVAARRRQRQAVVGTTTSSGAQRNASEKQIIAEKAAALLRPNTTVFLDPAAATPWHAVCRMSRC
ncbi:MAG: hypothetical protein ACLT4C_06460 [Butyricicoccus sp.]